MPALHVVRHAGPTTGVPVLLLHGLGSSAGDWERQIPALLTRYAVLAVDLRGHGRSPRAAGAFTVEALADDVARTLGAEGVPAVHAVGLSLGACVALALALRHPARVRSLTLVNGFARFASAGPGAALRLAVRLVLLAAAPMSVVGAHVARGLFPRPEQAADRALAATRLARTPRGVYLAALAALARWDARDRLGDVRCPTLVVVGDRDTTVPRRAAAELVAAIPTARLVVLPDAGHIAVWDAAEAFNRALLAFLSGVQ
ncbi:MAG: alpha/beta fold hydrolase [Candidatus Rokubacteria bacterium]|nr:alpha/beta fold hydrolase [Candidatus Rokubacteria bacterium]